MKLSGSKFFFPTIIVILVLFRIFVGLQINFTHEDYVQVYLLGLENAYSGQWSYWGPDVVWSGTQIPGALQGLLIGIPLKITAHPYSPIILSNIISAAGLILLAYYTKKRFPELPFLFLLIFYLLFPFSLQNGVVLLNTSYLIFTGAVLFICVAELFLYRNDTMLKNPIWYFFAMGFSMIITCQLHLSWVMFMPFIIVLLALEHRRKTKQLWKLYFMLLLGMLIAGSTLIPTIVKFPDLVFLSSNASVIFQPGRLLEVFDMFARYFSVGTFEVMPDDKIFQLVRQENILAAIFAWALKVFSLLQFVGLLISYYFVRKEPDLRKTAWIFFLSLLMALLIYAFGNKHMSMRTYILLFPIPVWLSFYAYTFLFRKKVFRLIMYASLALVFLTFSSMAYVNYNNVYSFKSQEEKLKKAIEIKDPGTFGERRNTLMNSNE